MKLRTGLSVYRSVGGIKSKFAFSKRYYLQGKDLLTAISLKPNSMGRNNTVYAIKNCDASHDSFKIKFSKNYQAFFTLTALGPLGPISTSKFTLLPSFNGSDKLLA